MTSSTRCRQRTVDILHSRIVTTGDSDKLAIALPEVLQIEIHVITLSGGLIQQMPLLRDRGNLPIQDRVSISFTQ